jgi:hypothetical protein
MVTIDTEMDPGYHHNNRNSHALATVGFSNCKRHSNEKQNKAIILFIWKLILKTRKSLAMGSIFQGGVTIFKFTENN